MLQDLVARSDRGICHTGRFIHENAVRDLIADLNLHSGGTGKRSRCAQQITHFGHCHIAFFNRSIAVCAKINISAFQINRNVIKWLEDLHLIVLVKIMVVLQPICGFGIISELFQIIIVESKPIDVQTAFQMLIGTLQYICPFRMTVFAGLLCDFSVEKLLDLVFAVDKGGRGKESVFRLPVRSVKGNRNP